MIRNASSDTNVYICSGATLRGTGQIVASPLVEIQTGGTLAPGTPSAIGALTVANNLILRSGSFCQFRINRTGVATNDSVRGLQTVALDGTLTVTLTGSVLGGEVFKLFDATSYGVANFNAFALPALPSTMAWDTTKLTTDGTLRVIGGTMKIGNTTRLLDGNFQFDATGWTNQNYRVLATTNVSTPLSNWVQVGSGTTTGVFTFTDLDATNYPQRYYRVVAP